MFPFWYTKSWRGLAQQGLLWVMSRVWVHPLFCRCFCSGRYWTIEPASDLEFALAVEFFSCICVRNLRTGFVSCRLLMIYIDMWWISYWLCVFQFFKRSSFLSSTSCDHWVPKAPRRWFMAMSPPWRIAATPKPGLWQSGARRSSAWWWEMVQTNRLQGHQHDNVGGFSPVVVCVFVARESPCMKCKVFVFFGLN